METGTVFRRHPALDRHRTTIDQPSVVPLSNPSTQIGQQ